MTTTKQQLSERLRALALEMAETAGEIAYLGGFSDEWNAHSRELFSAAHMVMQWHKFIAADSAEGPNP